MNLGYENGLKDGFVNAAYLVKVSNVINDRKITMGYGPERLDVPIESDFTFLKSSWYLFPINYRRKSNYGLEKNYIEINNNFNSDH